MKKPIFEFWDHVNAAMEEISSAALLINNEQVKSHLKEHGYYEENIDAISMAIKYIKNMFAD